MEKQKQRQINYHEIWLKLKVAILVAQMQVVFWKTYIKDDDQVWKLKELKYILII